MELTKHLRVTPEEFFDQIEESVIEDIEDATGKTVSRGRLNGYKYKKRASGGSKGGTPMTVKIRHYQYPRLYEVRFTYPTGTNTMRYSVTPDGDGCLVVYSEDFTTPQSTSSVLARLQLKIYNRQMRSHAKKTLASIESYALRSRDAKDPAEKDEASDGALADEEA